MSRVHIVQLRLKLESQLHLFLVVLGILHVFLLQFQTHLLFICSILFQGLTVLLKGLHVLFESFLVVCLLLETSVVHSLDRFHFLVMLSGYFGDEHSIIGSAAVFK